MTQDQMMIGNHTQTTAFTDTINYTHMEGNHTNNSIH
jgi:hypothetical protein